MPDSTLSLPSGSQQTPRDGDRGPEHLSVQTQAGEGVGGGGGDSKDGDSQAPPYPPHPQPVLLRSGAQWQGLGEGGAQKLGKSLGLVYC